MMSTYLEKYIHNCLDNRHYGKKQCYPPSDLSDAQLDDLQDLLRQFMLDSMILDLYSWDVSLEDCLAPDCYWEIVFGKAETVETCVSELKSFFLEKVEEFDLDYNQHADYQTFENLIDFESKEFIFKWRKNIFNRFGASDINKHMSNR